MKGEVGIYPLRLFYLKLLLVYNLSAAITPPDTAISNTM